MNVLITSGKTALAQALSANLAKEHESRIDRSRGCRDRLQFCQM